MKLTPDAERAVAVITSLGGRPLLVGGFVRDQLLGIESKDIDIEVHGPVSPVELEAALRKVGRVDAVGVAFGVLKFGHDVDISFPRRDSKVGEGHTGFRVQFDRTMSVKEALSRRDFTINSMAFDPVSGELIDPFDGATDLLLHRLRHTSEAFADDPLRVLRGVQFAARFNLDIADETADLCKRLVPRFKELSVERVWMEWWKILTKGQSMDAVSDALWNTGWDVHFPEWDSAMSRFTDILIKKMPDDVDDYRRASIILGAMFACEVENLRSFLARIDAPRWLNDSLLLANTVPEQGASLDESVRRTARRLKGVRFRDWLFVTLRAGGEWWASAERQGILDQPRMRLLTGDHLIQHGRTPGPEFKVILDQALDVQDREGWTTETEALLWLRAHW